MNLRHQLILKILEAGGALNRNEIFEQLEPAEQGLFNKGVDGVSQDLDVLKRKKQFVENGISDVINGKMALTWKLTDEGKRALLLLDQPKAPSTEPQPAEEHPNQWQSDPVFKQEYQGNLIIEENPRHTPLFELGYTPDDSLSIAKDYAALAQKYAQAAVLVVQGIILDEKAKTLSYPKVKNKTATIATLRSMAEFIRNNEALNHAADILEMLEEDPS